MLVITRTPGQSAIVRVPGGSSVLTVSVLEVRGNRVRIGFDGVPEEFIVIRSENLPEETRDESQHPAR